MLGSRHDDAGVGVCVLQWGMRVAAAVGYHGFSQATKRRFSVRYVSWLAITRTRHSLPEQVGSMPEVASAYSMASAVVVARLSPVVHGSIAKGT